MASAKLHFDYLPMGLFGAVMGLSGLSVAWHLAETPFGAPDAIALAIGIIAVAAFVAIACAYIIKLVQQPAAVRDEFNHPVSGNLFGTLSISLLLLPAILARFNLGLAQGVWIAGVAAMVGLAWIIVSRWISVAHEVHHITPTWILPVVGLLDIPAAFPLLHLPQADVVVSFGLAVGLFFAVPVFILNFARLSAGPRLPEPLAPTLLMLEAPFSVGFTAYVIALGHDDLFADSLYMLMLFIAAVLRPRLVIMLRGHPFRLGWWAVSFPLAASAVAALRFAAYHPGWLSIGIAAVLLGIATLVIGGLLIRTLIALVTGQLRAVGR